MSESFHEKDWPPGEAELPPGWRVLKLGMKLDGKLWDGYECVRCGKREIVSADTKPKFREHKRSVSCLDGPPPPQDVEQLLKRLRIADDEEALRELNNELGAAAARGIMAERERKG